MEHELGLYVAGGKGATSRKTPGEIELACERLGRDPAPLVRASKLSAKVDNTAVQSGHQLYHRSEEHTSELQSRQYLVCRLLLEKKKQLTTSHPRPRRDLPRADFTNIDL